MTSETPAPTLGLPAPQLPSSPFYGKTILAPMVRICGLGFRVLCTASGADVLFTEELVAAKLRLCRREVRRYPLPHSTHDEVAEYVTYQPFKKGFKRTVVLAVYPRPADSDGSLPRRIPLILQLGAKDGEVAADAAALCSRDVDGVDINMGCPKAFSVANGFGAALMNTPADAGRILQCVHARLNSPAAVSARGGRHVPVSFKTRLRDDADAAATVTMMREIASAASHSAATPVLHAVTLHARTRDQRSNAAPLLAVAAEVARLCRLDPVLAGLCLVLNGSIASRDDGAAACARLGFDAAMLARAALYDPVTVFRPGPPAPGPDRPDTRDEAHYLASIKALLLASVRYRADFTNFKYHLCHCFPEVPCIKAHMPFIHEKMRSYADSFDLFNLTEEERAECRRLERPIEIVDTVPEPPKDLIAGDDAGSQSDEDEQEVKRPRPEA